MTVESYATLLRDVRAALAREDPLGLADPAIDLAEEYDAEAREIARRLVRANGAGDAAVTAATIVDVLVDGFGEAPSARVVERIATRIAVGRGREPGRDR